jgi:potassium-dependent mechanosensitive channel
MRQYTKKLAPRQLGLCWSILGAASLLWLGPFPAGGQTSATDPTNTSFSASAPGTNAAPISPAEVGPQAEEAFASLHDIDRTLAADQATVTIQEDLPVLTSEASARQEENSRMLASSPSLETLRRQAGEWRAIREELADWKRTLSKRIAQVQQDQAKLAGMETTWEATRSSGTAAKMPPAVLQQVDRVLAAVKRTRANADSQLEMLLTLQSQVTEQDGRARHELDTVETLREAYLRRLLARDSPPIWSPQVWSESAQNLAQQGHRSLSRQADALRSYIERKRGNIVLQALVFLAIVFVLAGVGRRLRRLGGEEAGSSARIFDAPIATALVLSLLASSWIYPQAPRLFWALCGAVALVPTTFVVRRLIERPLFPVLNALVVFYFTDQLRTVGASQALFSRVLLLAEMLAGAIFVGYLLRYAGFGARANETWWPRGVAASCRVALAVFALAFIAGVTGYMNLSKFLSHALLQSAYMALILYAVVRIFDGLFLSLLSIPPLVRLGVVQRHRALLQSRAQVVLEWTAIVLWAAYVLETLSLRAPVFNDLREAFKATIGAGAFKFTLGDIVWFGICVWASVLVSRALRFVLEEEVYPRVELAPGLHYSISKMVNYAILVLGFVVGIAILGFDLTKLTILVGALGVGLGFGLQNIINNFVSGLILLFERPIKVGDVIQLGGNEGMVKQIGIRASIVRLMNGAELIVPNGSLISETVTNWTRSDKLRRIDLPVAVLAPADAKQVLELLEGAAAKHPEVLKAPPPRGLLVSFDKDSMSLELRFWTNQSDDWPQIRSELALAIRAALAERNIPVK